MIILGESSDDRGTQLEELTKRILVSKGYNNIVTNHIGPGGAEIDVSADFSRPGIVGNHTNRLICECKAYKSVIDTTSWMKFLGKVFMEEVRNKSEVLGCFIALSGVNGNVSGNYDELLKHRNNITLITGENLLETTRELYSLADIESITHITSNFTDRPIRMIDICYYRNSVYFVIAFNNDEYTLLDSNGGILKPSDAHILSMIEESLSTGSYVNIEEEQKAKRRSIFIQKAILTELMLENGEVDKEKLTKSINDKYVPCEETEFNKEIQLLIEKKFVCCKDVLFYINKNTDDIFVELFRFLLNDIIMTGALGCEYYDGLITHQVIPKIEEIQKGLKITDDILEIVMYLIRISPTALIKSLYPEPMIVSHYEQQLKSQQIELFDREYFVQMIYEGFLSDFNNPKLSRYFREIRGIAEVEKSQIIKIKSKEKLLFSNEWVERKAIGQMTDEYGGQYVNLLVLGNQPEPWEETNN
ncbi:restriction endonuclease [Paenibacillus sp. FSL M7-0802]|uniref:restriction endonuclease n=1 Tax=Paenibacillus sp. FSL M7-0802 TaxID=2921536 RepID=UPI0030F84B36